MVPNIYIYVYTHHKWLRKSSEVPSLGKATLFFPNNIQCQHIKPWFSFLDLLILAVGWPQPIVDDLRYPVEYVNQVQHGKSQRWTAIHHQHSSCCTNVSGTCPCHIHMRYLSRHECHMPYIITVYIIMKLKPMYPVTTDLVLSQKRLPPCHKVPIPMVYRYIYMITFTYMRVPFNVNSTNNSFNPMFFIFH